jgi:hypothetical protein
MLLSDKRHNEPDSIPHFDLLLLLVILLMILIFHSDGRGS